MESVGGRADDPHHQPEVSRVREVETHLREDEDCCSDQGERGCSQLEETHRRSAPGKYSVDDVDGSRESVVDTHKYRNRNT